CPLKRGRSYSSIALTPSLLKNAVWLRDLSQEIVEMGPRGALFRASWELRTRVHAAAARSLQSAAPVEPPEDPKATSPRTAWTSRLQLADPLCVAEALHDRLAPGALVRLQTAADEALAGRILCFDRWYADYGQPIDWHLSPVTRKRWSHHVGASRVLRDQE